MRQEILHGNCMELFQSLGSESIDLVVTDPPYKMTKMGKSCRPNYMAANHSGSLFDYGIIKPADWFSECFRVLKDGSHFYTFCNINDIQEYLNAASATGFKLHNIIAVIKDTKMPNRWYLKYTEQLLFFRKGRAKAINDMTSRDYEFVKTVKASDGKQHVTQKPLELMEKIVKNSSKESEVVLDPFCGSGTTLLAAKMNNRGFVGFEIDKNYYDICAKRLGLTAVQNPV